ncbi:MAG: AMIN domain-containing protein [Candidatus Dadabacteria bacterium]|nr:AMIN domain-containing protein [Candidatus Dadabacteria bacterium]MYA48054.1 AMIN domain-containing protein [Candidatus Dadabacteria bacterium]MYF47956.1 AMIN domain-containing protein [Candidatus Dadabacteria bacterium]MYG82807.1 AMIN domain-containing protein [Candidatus Dadabacteria bacterium]MYK49121.1 AMIN domain-containing protein [Candidatus Dadabacteria bacterium]
MKSRIKFSPFLIALICLFVFSPAGAKEKNEALYEETFKLYRQLESNSEKAQKRETWDLVGSTFYRIYSQNPDWKNSPLCLFVAARVYEKKSLKFKSPEDAEKALQYSREFLKKYPDDSLADDSWLRVGKIHERRGEKKEAATAYQRIVYGMEDSDTYEIAKKKLAIVTGAPTPKKAEPEPSKEPIPTPNPKGYALIKKIRHWSTDDYTRVVIETDKNVKYTSNMLRPDPELKTPPRLYVDLEETILDNSVKVEPITKGLLEKISYATNRPGVSRIVLYIKDLEGHKVFSLPKSEQNPSFRLVMDIKGMGAKPEKIFAKDAPSYDKQEPSLSSKIPEGEIASLKQALGLKVRTIVIDPGHGGHDPGAIGPSGLREKDVNLKIAKRLRERLIEEGKSFGIENVYLTRSSDRFIPLEERTAIAKKRKADIFISIHCNGARRKKAHGIETYILGFTDDQTSLQLAARENATTTKGLNELGSTLKQYLLSAKKEESQQVAGYVQKSIIQSVSVKYKYVNNKGVKKAPFVVLIGADVPSLLIETSFITNPREEKRLKSKAYIERIVDGIVLGIKKYSMQTQKVS